MPPKLIKLTVCFWLKKLFKDFCTSLFFYCCLVSSGFSSSILDETLFAYTFFPNLLLSFTTGMFDELFSLISKLKSPFPLLFILLFTGIMGKLGLDSMLSSLFSSYEFSWHFDLYFSYNFRYFCFSSSYFFFSAPIFSFAYFDYFLALSICDSSLRISSFCSFICSGND